MKFNSANLLEAKQAQTRLDYLIEHKKRFELKQIRAKRSISQNSYLHVVIALYAIHFGHTLYEAKVDLKRMCDFMTYVKNGKMYLVQTSKQDSKELTLFIEWVRNLAGKNGCYIPTSEEYLLDRYSIDKEIDSHKQYI